MADDVTDKMPHQLFGNGEPPATTRERILEHAQDLFYSKGFHAVGIDEIAAHSSVTKATIYNHFESRDELTLEVIKRADELMRERFLEAVRARSGWDAKAALLGIFDVLHEWFNHPDFQGCLFVKACMAFPNKHDPIHKAASSHYFLTASEVSEMATQIGISDPRSFAREWVLLIEGALTYRAITLDNDAAHVAKRIAEGVLERFRSAR